MSLYTCRSTPTGFRFAKFPDDLAECEATYTVSTDGRFCTCPAAHRFNCKHREMLIDFRATSAIDTGRLYDPDEGRWQPCIMLVDDLDRSRSRSLSELVISQAAETGQRQTERLRRI